MTFKYVPMTFNSIDEILNHDWVGNHAFDAAAFDAVDNYLIENHINDDATIARVMRDVSIRAMGIDVDMPDDSELAALWRPVAHEEYERRHAGS